MIRRPALNHAALPGDPQNSRALSGAARATHVGYLTVSTPPLSDASAAGPLNTPDARAALAGEAALLAAQELDPALRLRLAPIRLLCLDMDGILTDGHLYFTGEGWSQRFCVRDGYGVKLLQAAGIEVAVLSGGEVPSGRARAASLGLRHARFGVVDKVAEFTALAGALGISAAETAFMGDELPDIPLLRLVGFAATVPEAVAEVRAAAHYVTRCRGGDGAVREVADLLRRQRAAAGGSL